MVKSFSEGRSTARARQLGRRAGARTLIFMTDHTRAPDTAAVCQHLPADTIIIFRDYTHPDRAALAVSLRRVTRQLGQAMMVAGDAALARRIGADGLHLPQHMLWQHPDFSGFRFVSAACHSRSALRRAESLKVDFALVSPVFATASHPEGAGLGTHRFARLIQGTALPVVALGGINHQNAGHLKGLKLAGIAAIGAFTEK